MWNRELKYQVIGADTVLEVICNAVPNQLLTSIMYRANKLLCFRLYVLLYTECSILTWSVGRLGASTRAVVNDKPAGICGEQ